MQQVLQSLRNGKTYLEEVPCPGLRRNTLLIQSQASLISAGTERMLVEFSKAGLLGKAKAQPEKVQQVLNKIKTDGLMPTVEAVFSQLDEPLPLGYCNAGIVLEVGPGVTEFKPGDRVASNGPHAEIVCVPTNLCAKLPDQVSFEQASFTVLASIALQGMRLIQPTLGEKVVVYGLGLIGLITVQLLRASGCQVLGIDLDPERLHLAEQFGAVTVNPAHGTNPIAAAMSWSEGRGVDAVLITASASDDDIVHESAEMSRKRGRIVLVGVVDLNLRRNDFYKKELTFQVSCSYGPGRYDESYEAGGLDYPLGFVRWTEQRNFEAIVEMLASQRLDVSRLITHRYSFTDAVQAYEALGDKSSLGVVLQYEREAPRNRKVAIPASRAAASARAVVGVIGAGLFSKTTLMPALARSGARIAYVANLNGVASTHLAMKYDAAHSVTDYRLVLQDPEVEAVLIAVGHHLHSQFVCEALDAGKHVVVEKPLAMNLLQVAEVLEASHRHPRWQVMVGFNRRFSPHTAKIRELLHGRNEPLAMTMTVNAGMIPPDHWIHDPQRGGGRIVGEACHFIDLMAFLCGSRVQTVSAIMMSGGTSVQEDKMAILLGFEDGSVGTVNYFANGSKSYPKEQLEVFSEGRVVRLDNFRRTTGFGFSGFRKFSTWRQDKGHTAEFAAFVQSITAGGTPLIPLEESVNVTLASFAAMTSAAEGRTVTLDEEYRSLFVEAEVGIPCAATGSADHGIRE